MGRKERGREGERPESNIDIEEMRKNRLRHLRKITKIRNE